MDVSFIWVSYILLTGGTLALQSGPVVNTKYGKVQGAQSGESFAFTGIPFATPPVGHLRWKAPLDVKPWSPSIYDATTIKPGCPQYACSAGNPQIACPNKTSEDCLYLNIWTPVNATPSSKLAVMLYLHGGNFVDMSSGSIVYDGRFFAPKGNVVYIGADYRMGALGFLVTGKGPNDATGNYGLMDQRLAMKWVKENIINFGGDPDKITLWGQSAGSQSIAIHLMNKKSDSYFRASILESCPFVLPFKSYNEAIVLGALLSQLVGCEYTDISCLRNTSANDIAKAQFTTRSMIASLKLFEMFEPWGPYVDGDEVIMQPIDGVTKGLFGNKPMLIGSNSQETIIFIYSAWHTPLSFPEYAEIVEATEPGYLTEIFNQYPPTHFKDERKDMWPLSTDVMFSCSTRFALRNMTQWNNTNVYLYLYDYPLSFPGWGKNLSFCDGKVCHGTEIVYVFQTASLGGFNYTKEGLVLSNQLIQYWTNFAKTLDPNSGSGKVSLPWPKYNPKGNSTLLHFKVPELDYINNFNKGNCDFWDTIGYDEKVDQPQLKFKTVP